MEYPKPLAALMMFLQHYVFGLQDNNSAIVSIQTVEQYTETVLYFPHTLRIYYVVAVLLCVIPLIHSQLLYMHIHHTIPVLLSYIRACIYSNYSKTLLDAMCTPQGCKLATPLGGQRQHLTGSSALMTGT